MYVCPDCKASRWRTLRKGKIYKCRNCGYTKGGEVVKTTPIKETVPIVRGIPIKVKETKLNWWQKLWQKRKH